MSSKVHGKDAGLTVNGKSMEDDGNRVTLTITPDTIESTTFAELAKTHLEGHYGWTLDYEGFWNSASNANDQTFHAMVGVGGGTIKVYPEGTALTKIYYFGTAILTSFNSEATVGGGVTCSASLLGNGCLQRLTVA